MDGKCPACETPAVRSSIEDYSGVEHDYTKLPHVPNSLECRLAQAEAERDEAEYLYKTTQDWNAELNRTLEKQHDSHQEDRKYWVKRTRKAEKQVEALQSEVAGLREALEEVSDILTLIYSAAWELSDMGLGLAAENYIQGIIAHIEGTGPYISEALSSPSTLLDEVTVDLLRGYTVWHNPVSAKPVYVVSDAEGNVVAEGSTLIEALQSAKGDGE